MESAFDSKFDVSENEEQPWKRTLLLLPRMGLRIDATGVSRQLLLPGQYETRMSRRFHRPLFRTVRR